ncbi:MAG: LysE family translocator [Humibacillus sp.]|nr:LysE family translocator [Humibacillus sp.]MDN5775930.1 LysE family translocator [Humibacillus sp.]
MRFVSVLSFWGVASVLIAVPGPDWAFAIDAGLRRHGAAAAGGIVLGYAGLTLVVVAGLGLLLATTPAALFVFTAAGALYLIWRGSKTLRDPADFTDPRDRSTTSARRTLFQGMVVSGLNPKALLIFLALLPQFTSTHDRWPLPVQFTILGLVFTLTCGAFYFAIAIAATRLLDTRPVTVRIVTRISGVSMILLGVVLALERLIV